MALFFPRRDGSASAALGNESASLPHTPRMQIRLHIAKTGAQVSWSRRWRSSSPAVMASATPLWTSAPACLWVPVLRCAEIAICSTICFVWVQDALHVHAAICNVPMAALHVLNIGAGKLIGSCSDALALASVAGHDRLLSCSGMTSAKRRAPDVEVQPYPAPTSALASHRLEHLPCASCRAASDFCMQQL